MAGITNPDLTRRGEAVKEAIKDASKEKKDLKRITVRKEDQMKVPVTVTTGIIRASEFCGHVSSLFTSVFKDFAGVWLIPYAQGSGFDLRLYFNAAQNLPGAMKAFDVNDGKTKEHENKLYNAIKSRENQSTQRMYKLTDEAEYALSEFFAPDMLTKSGVPDWAGKGLCFESVINGNTLNGVYAVIRGFDINRICQLIYGNKDEDDGSRLDYQLIPGSNLQQMVGLNQTIQDYTLTIQCTSQKRVTNAAQAVGIITSYGIPMVGRIG